MSSRKKNRKKKMIFILVVARDPPRSIIQTQDFQRTLCVYASFSIWRYYLRPRRRERTTECANASRRWWGYLTHSCMQNVFLSCRWLLVADSTFFLDGFKHTHTKTGGFLSAPRSPNMSGVVRFSIGQSRANGKITKRANQIPTPDVILYI